MSDELTPFRVEAEAQLRDLRDRLARTRWPEPGTGGGLVPGRATRLHGGTVPLLGRGGHFAALEQPDLFVDELRAFFRLVR